MNIQEKKVLCVPTQFVTRGLGGVLFHGVHSIVDKELFISSIEPNLQVRTQSEIANDHEMVQIMPFLIFPHARLDQEGELAEATTALACYSMTDSSSAQDGSGRVINTLNTGFSNWVLEEHVSVYAKTDAPTDIEVVADEREGKIALFQSLQNSVQSLVRDYVTLSDREFTGEPDPEQMVVQDVGYVIVDHTNQSTQRFVGVVFMCVLPKQFQAGQGYSRTPTDGLVYADEGEITLKDLMAEDKYKRLSSWSRLVVENLYKAEKEHNADVDRQRNVAEDAFLAEHEAAMDAVEDTTDVTKGVDAPKSE